MYIFTHDATFASNSSGTRHVLAYVGNNSSGGTRVAPANGASTSIEFVDIISVSTTTTFSTRCRQTCGSNLSVYGHLSYWGVKY